jgi:hypothetical protein
MPGGWRLLETPLEVVPLDDLREHIEGDGCWCRPRVDEGVIVHNSADGREKYETRERVAS